MDFDEQLSAAQSSAVAKAAADQSALDDRRRRLAADAQDEADAIAQLAGAASRAHQLLRERAPQTAAPVPIRQDRPLRPGTVMGWSFPGLCVGADGAVWRPDRWGTKKVAFSCEEWASQLIFLERRQGDFNYPTENSSDVASLLERIVRARRTTVQRLTEAIALVLAQAGVSL